MPWITVTTDTGELTWAERALSTTFASEHFRAALAERLGWAVSDAEALERRRDADVVSFDALGERLATAA
jgi:hypothetical protein